MPTIFAIDGAAGKLGVYTGTDDLPLANPLSYLSRVKLHSDLDYPKIISTTTGSLTLPAMTNNTRRQVTHTLFAHGRPSIPWVLGRAVIGGVDIALSGTVPIQVDDALTGFGGFPRMIALGATTTNVVIHENAACLFTGPVHAAITINYTVYVTDVLP